jgi:AcrR family transcriptional regulator
MARPKSEDRRRAILDSATHIVATQGLTATTAEIAKRAGVSNGSLFIYFDTKTDLMNDLFVSLKAEMLAAASDNVDHESDARTQILRIWNQWLDWAVAFPEKRRALSQLDVSDDVTPQSHRVTGEGFAGIAAMLDRVRANGTMKHAPLGFVLALMTSVAETTIDAIISDPSHADETRALAFDALWRMVA